MKLFINTYNKEYKTQIIELILNIQQNEFHIPITLKDQPDLLDIPKFYTQFWVACNDNKVVGTVGLLNIGFNQVVIRKMFVEESYRGTLISTAQMLLNELIDWCKNNGMKEIFLGTTSKFIAAHKFYEKNNFYEIVKQNLPKKFPLMEVDTKFYCYKIISETD